MVSTGLQGVGISAHKRANDLSDFGAELDMIQALGVNAIEIGAFDLDLVIGGRICRPQLEALLRACRGRNVIYSVHGPLAINLMDEAWRLPRHFEVLEASLEVAAEIGAEHYVMHSGHVLLQQGAGIEAAYDQQREALSRAGDMARQHGLILCVETIYANSKGGHVASPKRLAQELAAVGHANVMATLDFGHSYLKLDYDGRRDAFVEEVAALAPFARHVHMHDGFGRQDDIWTHLGERVAYGHGDLHLPIGWGDIPWQAIMSECVFPDGVLFNIELNKRYWHVAKQCVDDTRALAEKARINGKVAAA